MAGYAPVPTEATETSMIHSDTDQETVNGIRLNIQLNLELRYSTNIDVLRRSYVLLVAVSVCLFVAVALYQTVMKALMIVLVVVVMVSLSYLMYVYMNNQVSLTTRFSIVKFLTKERKQDQNSEIHAAASVVNMGNVDPGISRTEETPQAQRHPETGSNRQDDTEIVRPTVGLQSDVVSSGQVVTIRDENDSSSDEDDLSSEENSALDGSRETPLYRSPSSSIHGAPPQQRLQPRQGQRLAFNNWQQITHLPEIIQQLRQEFQQNNFTSFQYFQQLPERQMQHSDFITPIFGFPFDENLAVMARPTTGCGSRSLVRCRTAASVGGPYSDHNEFKSYFDVIANKMPADWPQLATNLGLPFERIQVVKQVNNNDCWWCCHKVLEMWRSTNGAQATLEDLIQAVRETERQDVAEKLEAMQLD